MRALPTCRTAGSSLRETQPTGTCRQSISARISRFRMVSTSPANFWPFPGERTKPNRWKAMPRSHHRSPGGPSRIPINQTPNSARTSRRSKCPITCKFRQPESVPGERPPARSKPGIGSVPGQCILLPLPTEHTDVAKIHSRRESPSFPRRKPWPPSVGVPLRPVQWLEVSSETRKGDRGQDAGTQPRNLK